MSTIAGLYQEGRARLLDIAAGLDTEDAGRSVPACPEWRVRDVFAHLAGVTTDILAGRLDGVATDPWTARQVAERAGTDLETICAEWAGNAEALDSLLEALGDAMDPRLILDQWSHEQDIRGAIDELGLRDGDAARFCVATLAAGIDEFRRADNAPAVRLVAACGEWVLGEGEPVATIRGADFELSRALLGRRSVRQLEAMIAEGDPSVAAGLPVFAPRAGDLVE